MAERIHENDIHQWTEYGPLWHSRRDWLVARRETVQDNSLVSSREVVGKPLMELTTYTDVCKRLEQLAMRHRVKAFFDIKEDCSYLAVGGQGLMPISGDSQ